VDVVGSVHTIEAPNYGRSIVLRRYFLNLHGCSSVLLRRPRHGYGIQNAADAQFTNEVLYFVQIQHHILSFFLQEHDNVNLRHLPNLVGQHHFGKHFFHDVTVGGDVRCFLLAGTATVSGSFSSCSTGTAHPSVIFSSLGAAKRGGESSASLFLQEHEEGDEIYDANNAILLGETSCQQFVTED
jgi:hypothetical protein